MTQDDDSTEPMTVDMIVKISLDPQGMHEIFNLTLHVGHPWGRSFTSLIASLPQFDRPELVVSFPPDGYEFGINTSPFVMCYVQVTHQPCTFPETNDGHTRHLTSSLFPSARSALSPAILNPKPCVLNTGALFSENQLKPVAQDLSSTESEPHLRSPAVHFLVRSERLGDGGVQTRAQGISMMHISLGVHPQGMDFSDLRLSAVSFAFYLVGFGKWLPCL